MKCCQKCNTECLSEADYCDTCGNPFDEKDRNEHIILSTADIGVDYEVVDSICFVGSRDRGLHGRQVLEEVFADAKRGLRLQCVQLGGDAVVGCHFSERSAHSVGLIPTQVIEIWAYGTVVRFKSNASNQ
jgi:uncharacterized protein YbjQ (UPF0145 family)